MRSGSLPTYNMRTLERLMVSDSNVRVGLSIDQLYFAQLRARLSLFVRSLSRRLFATPVGVTGRCKTRRWSAIDGQRLALAPLDWRFPIGSFAIGSLEIGKRGVFCFQRRFSRPNPRVLRS